MSQVPHSVNLGKLSEMLSSSLHRWCYTAIQEYRQNVPSMERIHVVSSYTSAISCANANIVNSRATQTIHAASSPNPDLPQLTIIPIFPSLRHIMLGRWNKYTQIASRALRQALNETDRVAAEKRAQIGV
jgi:hypothetical protein